MSFRTALFLVVTLFSFAVSKTSFADDSKNLLKNYSKELSEIENYLNNIKYLTATFLQQSPDGGKVEGKFYLSRPGKMRISYSEPSRILIVVNGAVLAYQDLELEETSYLRTNSTPASFLTRKNISFSAKDVELTDVIKEKDFIKVSVIKKNRKEAGEFGLTFKTNPLRFSKMEVKNDMNEVTSVTLLNGDFDKKIDDKLFVIKDNKLPQ